ncbi:hypothetical protein D3C75_837580 [compost metagenome]
MDRQCRGLLPALRHRQPAGRALHRAAAADAADGRRHVRHAAAALHRRQPGGRCRLGGGLPAARLGHRRGHAPALAGRLLAGCRDDRRHPGCHHRAEPEHQHSRSTPRHPADRRHEFPGFGRGLPRLALPARIRPGRDDTGAGAPQPGHRWRRGAGDPAGRFPHPVVPRRPADGPAAACPAVAACHVRCGRADGYGACQRHAEVAVRPGPPGSTE